jgi:FkbM family methyltransferase
MARSRLYGKAGMGEGSALGEPFFSFVGRALPSFSPAMIFDVGANVGQSSRAFAAAFPASTIYAFEPAAATFAILVERLAGVERVKPFNLALGRRAGRRIIEHGGSSVSHRIAGIGRLLRRSPHEPATMTTGDRFCREHRIERIDFLKIDTEGGDLAVLQGFRRLLAGQRIGLAEAEVGMNRANKRHVPLAAVQAFLEPLGYSLFHLHEQVLDLGFSGRPILRRCNAVFISAALADAHRQKRRRKRPTPAPA